MAEPQIVRNPNILCGKPTIAGTRISVELILENLGAGSSVDDILAGYPHITRDQVLAALRYAAEAIRLPPAESAPDELEEDLHWVVTTDGGAGF